jgi:hypothetical protein
MTGCPEWCAGGHRCTADSPGGEHRSDPLNLPAIYGGMSATRVQRDGSGWLEVRVSIRLPDAELNAWDMARLLALSIDLAVRDTLAGRLDRAKRAYHRLTGTRVR